MQHKVSVNPWIALCLFDCPVKSTRPQLLRTPAFKSGYTFTSFCSCRLYILYFLFDVKIKYHFGHYTYWPAGGYLSLPFRLEVLETASLALSKCSGGFFCFFLSVQKRKVTVWNVPFVVLQGAICWTNVWDHWLPEVLWALWGLMFK